MPRTIAFASARSMGRSSEWILCGGRAGSSWARREAPETEYGFASQETMNPAETAITSESSQCGDSHPALTPIAATMRMNPAATNPMSGGILTSRATRPHPKMTAR
jgi:hypothetical protein